MVVVGADVHKRTHTFVAVDHVGKQVGQLTVAATAHAPKPRSLDLAKHQQALHAWLLTVAQGAAGVDEVRGLVAGMALDELEDIIALTARIKDFDKRLSALARRQVPALLALPGCGELSAAKLLGESAGITRFTSEARFARHSGVAPIPVWSGNSIGRVRMTRSGNRQLNCALHRIAITQIRLTGSLGKAYHDKKLAEGKSRTEALRCLKRRLTRTVFQLLTADHHNRQTSCLPAAA